MKKFLDNTKVYLFDMDGTIFLSNKEIPGSFDTIKYLQEIGKKVFLVTNNSSTTCKAYVEKLAKMGLVINIEQIITSASVTAELLSREYSNKRKYIMATEAVKNEMEESGVGFCEENPEVVVLTYDKEINYAKIEKFNRFLRNGALYIATHPDFVCPSVEGDMPDIGSYFGMFKCSSGKSPDIICGKPYSFIADFLKNKYSINAENVVMVGDRLYTDIKFGINSGFKTILVLSGETTKELYETSEIKADCVLNSIKEITTLISS